MIIETCLSNLESSQQIEDCRLAVGNKAFDMVIFGISCKIKPISFVSFGKGGDDRTQISIRLVSLKQ